MNTKNQGYLVEFIANNGYDSNVYYECGYTEYKTILANFTSKEVKDRTNCQVSWEEYAEQQHSENLFAAV